MPTWEKKYKLPANHGWRAKPGYKIFIADRGAVRFDIPQDWVFEPVAQTITFRDRPQLDDTSLLQVTVMYLNARYAWSGLPLPDVFEDVTKGDGRGSTFPGPLQPLKRADLELVWRESRFVDPGANREAVSRACLALADTIMPFITMDYWPEDGANFAPVWDEILRSLQLGNFVDGVAGPRLH